MKDQLLLLQKLQGLDTQIKEIRQSIEQVPAKLAPAKQDLAKLEAMLAAEREKIAETEAWRAEQEDVVKREEEALKNAKAKLSEAKNARDFSAASREIDNKKRSIHDREQEILKVYEALEAGKERLSSKEEDIGKLRALVEGEEAQFADVLAELKAKADAIHALRPEVESQIEANLLKRYNNVVKRRGTAVVAVKNGVCQGCHMGLPPQIANQIAQGESIQSCRQCNRLLYRPEDLESDSQEAEATAEAS